MFKVKLLSTSALIVVGSVCFLPSHSAAIRPDRSAPVAVIATGGEPDGARSFSTSTWGRSKNRNRDFLCTYGYTVSHYASEFSGGSFTRTWQHYAVPIVGKGKTVNRIVVTDSLTSREFARFEIGIYENKPGGRPGKVIARGSGRPKGGCFRTTVDIPSTFLTLGKKYWVEQTIGLGQHNPSSVYHAVKWGYTPKARHNALYRYHHSASFSSFSSSTSDWLPVSGPAPFVRVE